MDGNQETFDCGICLDPKKGAACHQMLDCNHVFCVQCLQDFYNNAITKHTPLHTHTHALQYTLREKIIVFSQCPGDNDVDEEDVTHAEDEAFEEDAYNDDTDVDEGVSAYAPTPKAKNRHFRGLHHRPIVFAASIHDSIFTPYECAVQAPTAFPTRPG
ncbi:hypothetical protein F4821DRAFT_194125 [Hypoxylon rubiginosum]|uniref:Uncharacterized protein n=1 Tax=Hypoxylon rubiginosum TaxID=110542 RepID=A0ACC0CSX9_9PEZI|nr:hypothetical protein F4821DRAFT_194125 [Hypoxylon rubiginosum]